MQHHSNAPPPHLRGHHMAMHSSAAGGPTAVGAHIPPMNMVPQTQPNQHHLTNGPLTTATNLSSQSQHLREHHHNRLTHQQQSQHHPQSMHSSSQMQKIRQQHQHLNSSNNNNTNKNIHQQYNNNANVPQQHMGVTQQLRNGPQHHHYQHQQQQQHLPHMKNHLQHSTNVLATSNIIKPQQTNNTTAPTQQHHYYANNKSKYNTPTNTNYVAPKTILQNPNRPAVVKLKLQTSQDLNKNVPATAATILDIAAASSSSNNIILTDISTPVVSASAAVIDINSVQPHIATTTGCVDVATVEDATANESNKENALSAAAANSDSDELCINNNNNILPNEDSSVAKNSKEKTPMCLVNELARFNKITHQYRLTSEKGPAHCKRFTVTLKLGDEEYSAEGFKIKKAQHLAAGEAIEKTKYKHPVPKIIRRSDESGSSRANITPTVELNALAMKLGQQTYYLFDPRSMPPTDGMPPSTADGMLPHYSAPPLPLGAPHHHMMSHPPPPPHPSYMRRGGAPHGYIPPHHRYNHRGGGGSGGYPPKFHPRYPMIPPPGAASHHPHAHPNAAHFGASAPNIPCKITLIVGKQKFVGIGRTLQQAKHDAAARALQLLKTQATNQLNDLLNNSLDENDSKSPISLVHEIGIKRSMTVHFKVLREEGPAHMRNFITACIVGSIATEGEGNGKKISKKRAAEKMLEELKKLPPLTPTVSPVKRIKVRTPGKTGSASGAVNATPNSKTVAATAGATASGTVAVERRKRTSASIKEKADVDADAENPITKLIQLQQNRKEKEPVFELIAKNGNENSRRREFIMEVAAQGMVARGTGNSKKLAKRNAAQNLLVAMGLDGTNTDIANSATETNIAINSSAIETTLVDNNNDINNAIDVTATPSVPAHIVATIVGEGGVDVPLISTSAGQVPGILILRQNKKHASKKKESATTTTITAATTTIETLEIRKDAPLPAAATSATKTAVAITVPNKTTVVGSSNNITAPTTTESGAVASTNNATATTSSGVHMKEQLLYLAKLLGFEVTFSDYPKGNHEEFLTIVTLSTNPPQICHGVGKSAEESQNDAAKNALKILSELGLSSTRK